MTGKTVRETQSVPVDGYKCPECRYPTEASTIELVFTDDTRENKGIYGECLSDSCGWRGELH